MTISWTLDLTAQQGVRRPHRTLSVLDTPIVATEPRDLATLAELADVVAALAWLRFTHGARHRTRWNDHPHHL
jgi:hypothetical protein